MALITVARLHREFGVPIRQASRLVNEQRGIASERYRMLWLVATICVLASLASSVFDMHGSRLVSAALSLAAALLMLLLIYLIYRHSRVPTLAAARAWRNKAVRPHA